MHLSLNTGVTGSRLEVSRIRIFTSAIQIPALYIPTVNPSCVSINPTVTDSSRRWSRSDGETR